jgi:trimethylamine--corrinoid protein Co-methyltransferase
MSGADIAAVGPFGDFLSLPGTYAHMREQSQPRLMDRRVREEWQAAGATDMYERARRRACELLDSHQREPLDEAVRQRMRAVVERADRERGS